MAGDPTGYIPPPTENSLAGFPSTFRTKPKTRFPGGKRQRWKGAAVNIYERDYLHGRVEKWNRRGDRHLGDFDHRTGRRIGAPDPARRPVEP